MNNGKICISVCAETADELIEQIKRAEDLADVIEIRFDCLNENEFDIGFTKVKILIKILEKSYKNEHYLVTFRPKEQGGKRDLTCKRENFWNSE